MPLLTRRSALLAGAAAALTPLTACGGSSKTNTSKEKTTVTVAALPLVDTAGLHIAAARGYFTDEGLQVTIKPVAQSIQALPALANGQIDVIAGGNYVTFLQAQEKGTLQVQILADAASMAPKFMGLMVLPGSPIRRAADVAGHSVAVNILHNIQTLTFDEILAASGVAIKQVRYRAVPFPQMGEALQRGQVDSVHVVEPFATELHGTLHARMAVDGAGPAVAGLPVSGYLTTKKFVDKNPKTAAALARALGKAQRLATSDRSAVTAVLPGYARIDKATADALALPTYRPTVDADALGRLIALMRRRGMMKTKIDPASLIVSPKR